MRERKGKDKEEEKGKDESKVGKDGKGEMGGNRMMEREGEGGGGETT